ncbi:haloacid dehalogenase type II [Kaarinaea lacus]
MSLTLAFDVYGTLIDTHGVVAKLQEFIGDDAARFSHTWREKQLEYSFRRGLMRKYETFAVCTRDALDYTGAFYKLSLTEEQKQELIDSYRVLPAFEDVADGLSRFRAEAFHLYAFSNGTADAVSTLLRSAKLDVFFDGVVSVDEIRSFKPDPDVYHHFLKQSNANAEQSWLISGNPFDCIGALSVGMKAAWVRRSTDVVFDPWGVEPTLTVSGMVELYEKLSN